MLKGCFLVVIDPNRQSGSDLSAEELADWIGACLYGLSRVLLVKAKPGEVNYDSLFADFEVETDYSIIILRDALSQYGRVSEPLFLAAAAGRG